MPCNDQVFLREKALTDIISYSSQYFSKLFCQNVTLIHFEKINKYKFSEKYCISFAGWNIFMFCFLKFKKYGLNSFCLRTAEQPQFIALQQVLVLIIWKKLSSLLENISFLFFKFSIWFGVCPYHLLRAIQKVHPSLRGEGVTQKGDIYCSCIV